jgi:hypothetical protein
MTAETYPRAVSTPRSQDALSLSSGRGVAILILLCLVQVMDVLDASVLNIERCLPPLAGRPEGGSGEAGARRGRRTRVRQAARERDRLARTSARGRSLPQDRADERSRPEGVPA